MSFAEVKAEQQHDRLSHCLLMELQIEIDKGNRVAAEIMQRAFERFASEKEAIKK